MRTKFQSGERVYQIDLERLGQEQPELTYRASIEGQQYTFEVLDAQPGQISIRLEGRPATIYWAADGGQQWLSFEGCTYLLHRPTPRAARAAADSGAGEAVRAPMPAQVREVLAAEGESVAKGQTLLLLEAMKMEIRIRAPAAGRVARVLVTAGQAVEKEQTLVELELG